MVSVEAYQIIEDIYRIPGGFGESGEIYGSIFIVNTPPVLIAPSGGKKLLNNLVELLDTLGITDPLHIFFPTLLWQEVMTTAIIQDHFSNCHLYIHESLVPRMAKPRDNFFTGRYDPTLDNQIQKQKKKLPKKLDNIHPINKLFSLETDKSKILVVPYDGPHEGHLYVYSRDHKLLCSGIILGLTPSNYRVYYLDFTGNVTEYYKALEFLKEANIELIAPSYDEPQIVRNTKVSTIEITNAIQLDEEGIYELCASQNQDFNRILEQYRSLHGNDYSSPPFDLIKLDTTIVRHHLSNLIKVGKIIEESNQYRKV